MRQLVYERRDKDIPDGGLLFGVERPHSLAVAPELAQGHFRDQPLYLDYAGADVERAQLLEEGLDFRIYDGISRPGFGLPLAKVGLNHGFEVVDIEMEGIVDIGDGGVDIARDRDVDEEDRPSPPGFEGAAGLFLPDHMIRRAGRA